jgi:multidrug efflux pump subunit AcrA (membrane-fusion protein)/GAF domain-containing protein
MAAERSQLFGQVAGDTGSLTVAEVISRLSRFEGPPEQFLVNLLAVQCHLAPAEAAVILRAGDSGPEFLAAWPQLPAGSTAPVWMAQAVEAAAQVAAAGKTAMKPIHGADDLYGASARRHVLMVPIGGAGSVRGIAAYLVESGDPGTLAHCRERLELSLSLLSLYEMRLTLQRRSFDLKRLRVSMETLAAVNEHAKAAGASMAFCNELSARWDADRVGIGFLRGRSVKLKALSHTEKIIRKMKLVQDIEAAMEECLDQDVEVFSPATAEAIYVSRSADELSRLHGPMAVACFPLRRGGEAIGVLTVERAKDRPLNLEEVESLRLTADLCTARLAELDESDRWFGARLAGASRKALAWAVGAKHTWAKVAAIAIAGFLAFAIFAKGNYRAGGSFVLESTDRKVVPAPFDGYIEAVYVEPGAKVIAGQTVLAKLETYELKSQLARSQAELVTAEKEMAARMTEGKTAEAQIASAKAGQAKADMALWDRRIADAEIKSPINGTVVSPDISRRVRDHVQIGDAMFEVAPIESLRAEVSVPEDEIADVVIALRRAQEKGCKLTGALATESDPGDHVGFVVERINPVAEVEDKQNVFKVRVTLDETRPSMHPGFTGTAKINIEKRSYAFIWTRKLVNWVRMKLWL